MSKLTPYDLAPRVAPEKAQNLTERVLLIRRIKKVTAGGKNMRFNAMVAVGDGKNIVGIGLGKAADLGRQDARRSHRVVRAAPAPRARAKSIGESQESGETSSS